MCEGLVKENHALLANLVYERSKKRMSCNSYFDQCTKYMGRSVAVRTRDGQMHRGVITNVNNSHVYLRPLSNGNLGGFGYGWGGGFGGFGGYGGYGGRGGYGGYGYGGGYGVALGAIAALSLLAFW